MHVIALTEAGRIPRTLLIYGRDIVTDPEMTSGSNCCPPCELTGNVSLYSPVHNVPTLVSFADTASG